MLIRELWSHPSWEVVSNNTNQKDVVRVSSGSAAPNVATIRITLLIPFLLASCQTQSTVVNVQTPQTPVQQSGNISAQKNDTYRDCKTSRNPYDSSLNGRDVIASAFQMALSSGSRTKAVLEAYRLCSKAQNSAQVTFTMDTIEEGYEMTTTYAVFAARAHGHDWLRIAWNWHYENKFSGWVAVFRAGGGFPDDYFDGQCGPNAELPSKDFGGKVTDAAKNEWKTLPRGLRNYLCWSQLVGGRECYEPVCPRPVGLGRFQAIR